MVERNTGYLKKIIEAGSAFVVVTHHCYLSGFYIGVDKSAVPFANAPEPELRFGVGRPISDAIDCRQEIAESRRWKQNTMV